MIQIDIPMPEACDVCPFNYDFCWCKAFENYDNWEKYSDDWNENVCERTTRPEYCPLKEHDAEWIEYPECLAYEGAYSDSHIVCSACKHVFSIMDNCTEEFDYCPHCGAKMKQEGG